MDNPIIRGSNLISQKIQASKIQNDKFFIGRLGSVEAEIFCTCRGDKDNPNEKSFARLRKEAWVSAGIWPPLNFQLEEFSHQYSAAIEKATVMAEWGENQLWGEHSILDTNCPHSERIPLGSLDPVLVAAIGGTPWTLQLEGKKVLVISSFSSEIKLQLSKKTALHNVDLYPNVLLETLAAPQTNGLRISNKSWTKQMKDFKNQVNSKLNSFKPDIVLVAAGAYGMPISAYIFENECSVIYVGGALQLIFGIWGNRWRTNPDVLKIANSNWIWPNKKSRPFGSFLVEKSSYW